MRQCTHPSEGLSVLFPARDYITGESFQITQCRHCGLTVTSPQPPPAELGRYYSPGYYGRSKANRFPAVVERLQRFLNGLRVGAINYRSRSKRGRILDIGCGRGFLLREFQRGGWEVMGTELSESAGMYARDVLNLPVRIGDFREMNLPANHFDAIVLWHVLEHVYAPQATLAEVNRLLKPGGVLMIGVPNFGAWEARFSRDKWFHLDVPRHLTHFTRDTLEKTLAETGFNISSCSGSAPEYDVFSFVQSCENRMGLRHNLLYELLRGRDAKVMFGGAPFWQVALAVLFAVPLGIVSVPFTVLAGLLNRGGTITVVAMKEKDLT
jgi:SAM-dependent methyltransferase